MAIDAKTLATEGYLTDSVTAIATQGYIAEITIIIQPPAPPPKVPAPWPSTNSSSSPVTKPEKKKYTIKKPLEEVDAYIAQALREDNEIIEIIISLTMSDIL